MLSQNLLTKEEVVKVPSSTFTTSQKKNLQLMLPDKKRVYLCLRIFSCHKTINHLTGHLSDGLASFPLSSSQIILKMTKVPLELQRQ